MKYTVFINLHTQLLQIPLHTKWVYSFILLHWIIPYHVHFVLVYIYYILRIRSGSIVLTTSPIHLYRQNTPTLSILVSLFEFEMCTSLRKYDNDYKSLSGRNHNDFVFHISFLIVNWQGSSLAIFILDRIMFTLFWCTFIIFCASGRGRLFSRLHRYIYIVNIHLLYQYWCRYLNLQCLRVCFILTFYLRHHCLSFLFFSISTQKIFEGTDRSRK